MIIPFYSYFSITAIAFAFAISFAIIFAEEYK